MAQTVLQQVLILAAMMMLGFLLGKLGKVERKGADLLSMLLLDVFFPCNILAAASGDFGDMPFSQVIICPASFCLHFWPSRLQNCSG
jgi:predicted permease